MGSIVVPSLLFSISTRNTDLTPLFQISVNGPSFLFKNSFWRASQSLFVPSFPFGLPISGIPATPICQISVNGPSFLFKNSFWWASQSLFVPSFPFGLPISDIPATPICQISVNGPSFLFKDSFWGANESLFVPSFRFALPISGIPATPICQISVNGPSFLFKNSFWRASQSLFAASLRFALPISAIPATQFSRVSVLPFPFTQRILRSQPFHFSVFAASPSVLPISSNFSISDAHAPSLAGSSILGNQSEAVVSLPIIAGAIVGFLVLWAALIAAVIAYRRRNQSTSYSIDAPGISAETEADGDFELLLEVVTFENAVSFVETEDFE
jgi:hypothetical protein